MREQQTQERKVIYNQDITLEERQHNIRKK